MQVLYIGSEGKIVQMTCRILARGGFPAVGAIGSREGCYLLGRRIFDLVILECDLRKGELENLIGSVKALAKAPKLILISSDPEDEVPLLRSGADDWLRKPYQMEVLLARMAALLR